MAALPLLGLPRCVWLGFIAAPFAWRAGRRLLQACEDTPRIIPAQVWTLLSFVLYALGAGLGMLIC